MHKASQSLCISPLHLAELCCRFIYRVFIHSSFLLYVIERSKFVPPLSPSKSLLAALEQTIFLYSSNMFYSCALVKLY